MSKSKSKSKSKIKVNLQYYPLLEGKEIPVISHILDIYDFEIKIGISKLLNEECSGLTMLLAPTNGKPFAAVLFPTGPCEINTIAHEASHVVDHLNDIIGAETLNLEPRAYLIGYVTEIIAKYLKSKKVKIII
jgi:hypothetical protein